MTQGLGDGFAGEVIQPGAAGYDTARTVWNAMVDRKPALIARCTSPDDVAAALRFGQASGLEIGVRCGGHSVLGLPIADGGLTIDLSPMNAVRVDADRRRAWIDGGALLGLLDRATQESGLATTAGNVSHTGVGGLTLGGGMGWLARRYGLACDNVAAFDVVAADGSRLRATESENTDLYWGLRGGGGNFGVVTRFEFRLHPVGTRALSVALFFPLAEGMGPMRVWRDLLAEAPREATLQAWVGTAGDWPFLPARLHGQPMLNVGYIWVGDPDEGRRLLLPALRAAGTPAGEQVVEMSYLDLQQVDDSPEGHAFRRYWKGHYLREFPDAAIEAYLSRGAVAGEDPALLAAASLQHYGGAIADVPDGETAYSQRDAVVEFIAASRWSEPAEDAARMAAARRYAALLEPYASGVYVNVLTDEGAAGVRRAYGADKFARLTALKDRYDPGNTFHLNQNIPPSS